MVLNPGAFIKETKQFIPNHLPFELNWKNKDIDLLLVKSVRLLGELNAYSKLVPDVDFFIRMHVVKEATVSSRIEGTRTEIEEALLPEEEIEPDDRDDWHEIQNYISALNFAIEQLETLPISVRVINATHKILLSGVRGKNKAPGQMRKTQNWIGGTTEETALFIPPPANKVKELVSNLELFWHSKEIKIPDLIKIGLTHYQFETIHPYLDGNGRMGRLLITLQLVESDLLSKPTLYLSQYFERNKGDYYDALTLVRENKDIEHWLMFFLQGVVETSENSIETFEKIIDLREFYNKKVLLLGSKAKKAEKLISELYKSPFSSVEATKEILNTSYPTANRLIADLVNLEILKEVTGFSRNRLFVLEDYLNIFKRN